MLYHALVFAKADVPQWLLDLLQRFPGVQIFFALSGYLIFQSYENTRDARQFYRNRFLRLYPGLIACFVASVAAVFAVGYLRALPDGFALWTIAQLTFLQFYNPDFMRNFGMGVLNGALWTISVELQFYTLTPLLHRMLARSELRFLAAIAVFTAINVAYIYATRDGLTMQTKVVMVTFLPWLYIFLVGAYLSRHQEAVRWLAARAVPIGIAYLVASWVAQDVLPFGQRITPPFLLFLLAAIFAFAFFKPDTAERLLRRNDISYGVYIYHMPVLNTLLFLGIATPWLVIAIVVPLGMLSWALIERPALRAKRLALRTV